MNNFVSVFVAMLEHLGLLTKDEAEKLVKEIHSATLPDSYEGAQKFIKELFSKHEVSTLSSKISPLIKTASLDVGSEVKKLVKK